MHLDLHFDCHYIITQNYSREDAESSDLSRPKGVRCGNMQNNQHTSVIQERPAKYNSTDVKRLQKKEAFVRLKEINNDWQPAIVILKSVFN